MKKKYLENLQMNISNNYCKKLSIAFIFNQRNLFNSFIQSSFFYIWIFIKNGHSKNCLKFLVILPLIIDWQQILKWKKFVKFWSGNNICIPIHPRIIYFDIRLFGGAAYQGREEIEAETEGTDERRLSDKSQLIRC